MAARKTKKKDAVAVIPDATAIEAMDFGEHEGVGTEQMTTADQAMPFLQVLQGLSKAVVDPTQKVEGAQPGMFMNSVTKELTAGDEGVIFVPCSTSRMFIEWEGKPGQGKVVGRHEASDPMVKAALKKHAFGKWQSPAGNRLVETFYLVGMVLENSTDIAPSGMALLPITSTKIKSYKESIGVFRTLPHLRKAPLYALRLRLTTKAETRPDGTSFNIRIMPDGYGGDSFKEGVNGCIIPFASEQGAALYPLGKQLADDFRTGDAKVDYDGADNAGSETGGSEDEPY